MNGYPSDLTVEQYEAIKNLLPKSFRLGRPCAWDFIIILNAILYIVRSGCTWRMLPKDFPPWQTVYYHFNRLKKNGVWKKIHDELVCGVREKMVAIQVQVRGLLTVSPLKPLRLPESEVMTQAKRLKAENDISLLTPWD